MTSTISGTLSPPTSDTRSTSRSPAPTTQSRRLRRRTALERRNQLVENHRGLVRPLAVHYWRCTPEPLEDLIQVGLLGLIRAAELFQPKQGTPFEAFARPHIRGAILHHLRDSAQAVRLPRRQAELQEKLLRLQRDMAMSDTTSGLGVRLRAIGIEPAQAELLLRHRRLNRPMALMPEHFEWIAAPSEAEADALEHAGGEGEGGAQRLLAGLESRERLVVEQVVLAGLSCREMAKRLGVSPMTVQRLLRRALDRLRSQLTQGAPTLSRGLSLSPARSAAAGW